MGSVDDPAGFAAVATDWPIRSARTYPQAGLAVLATDCSATSYVEETTDAELVPPAASYPHLESCFVTVPSAIGPRWPGVGRD